MKLYQPAKNPKNRIRPLFLCLALMTAGIGKSQAELPILSDPPWLGYFTVFANKNFQFSITSEGVTTLKPLEKEADYPAIPITFGIEQILPDGKTTSHPLQPETFESSQPATADLKKTSIQGKFASDATFELAIEQERGLISMGGHVTNPGSLEKGSLRFIIQIDFSKFHDATNKGDWDKQQTKEFEKKVSNDAIRLKWTDGKTKKQTFERAVTANSNDISGPGIASMEIESSAFGKRRLNFMSSLNSAMVLSNPQTAPLYDGFSIRWASNPSKDPSGKGRISFTVK
jgi:hypothetical protein